VSRLCHRPNWHNSTHDRWLLASLPWSYVPAEANRNQVCVIPQTGDAP
jgi:hypothetical protein